MDVTLLLAVAGYAEKCSSRLAVAKNFSAAVNCCVLFADQRGSKCAGRQPELCDL